MSAQPCPATDGNHLWILVELAGGTSTVPEGFTGLACIGCTALIPLPESTIHMRSFRVPGQSPRNP